MAVKLPRALKLPREVHFVVKFARASETGALNFKLGSSIVQTRAVLRLAYFSSMPENQVFAEEQSLSNMSHLNYESS